MWTFNQSEMISSTVFLRNFWEYIKWMKDLKFKKLWILKNNEIDMVAIPWKIYEKVWSYIDEIIEQHEIYDEIKDRISDEKMVKWEDVLKKINLI